LTHGWIEIGWFRSVTAETSRFARLQRILFLLVRGGGERPNIFADCRTCGWCLPEDFWATWIARVNGDAFRGDVDRRGISG